MIWRNSSVFCLFLTKYLLNTLIRFWKEYLAIQMPLRISVFHLPTSVNTLHTLYLIDYILAKIIKAINVTSIKGNYIFIIIKICQKILSFIAKHFSHRCRTSNDMSSLNYLRNNCFTILKTFKQMTICHR